MFNYNKTLNIYHHRFRNNNAVAERIVGIIYEDAKSCYYRLHIIQENLILATWIIDRNNIPKN